MADTLRAEKSALEVPALPDSLPHTCSWQPMVLLQQCVPCIGAWGTAVCQLQQRGAITEERPHVTCHALTPSMSDPYPARRCCLWDSMQASISECR